MKRFLLILFFKLFLFNCTFSQKTKVKKVYFKQSKTLKEEYTILKKNKKIKQGAYQSFYYNGKPASKGNYKNNLKDGQWIYFKTNGQYKAIEHFTNGKKSGIWCKFIESGQVVKRYDHDQNKAIDPLIRVQAAYPRASRDAGIEGVVKFQIKMDKNCEIQSLHLIQSLNQECDEVARNTLNRIIYLRKKYLPLNCAFENDTFSVNFNLN